MARIGGGGEEGRVGGGGGGRGGRGGRGGGRGGRIVVRPKLVIKALPSLVSDACWAFSYITDGTNEKIQWVIETGVVPRFVQLLHLSEGENAALITPCLRYVQYVC